jgi:hypothetical protein
MGLSTTSALANSKIMRTFDCTARLQNSLDLVTDKVQNLKVKMTDFKDVDDEFPESFESTISLKLNANSDEAISGNSAVYTKVGLEQARDNSNGRKFRYFIFHTESNKDITGYAVYLNSLMDQRSLNSRTYNMTLTKAGEIFMVGDLKCHKK